LRVKDLPDVALGPDPEGIQRGREGLTERRDAVLDRDRHGGKGLAADQSISPSAMFVPGERTGRFRLGRDQLLANESGSSISFEDYAIALVDEMEKPVHSRQRFTVGY
jgi:putative NADH-flavin reductase